MFAPGLYGLPVVDPAIKPVGVPVRLNRRHALAPDRYCMLLNEGAGSHPRNYARDNEVGTFDVTDPTEDVVWAVREGRLTIDLQNNRNSANQTARCNLPPITNSMLAGTVVVRCIPDQVGAHSFNALCFAHADWENNNRIYVGQRTTANNWGWRLGSSGWRSVSSPAVAQGVPATLALTWADGTGYFFVDGVEADTAAFSGTPGSALDRTAIGWKGSDDDHNFNGGVEYCYVWTRALTHSQVFDISHRPYQIFNYDLPVWAVEAAAPGGGWVMSSLAAGGGLAAHGGLAGSGGGLAG